jgi:hypothetical protein
MGWQDFIQRCDRDGPMILERERQEKYAGGHTLRKLLENHQHAVCKDPRDKIYGFVGLATDARGFPMDYQKSLLEVWKDTMVFSKSISDDNRSCDRAGPCCSAQGSGRFRCDLIADRTMP